jgi:hypothetical protein
MPLSAARRLAGKRWHRAVAWAFVQRAVYWREMRTRQHLPIYMHEVCHFEAGANGKVISGEGGGFKSRTGCVWPSKDKDAILTPAMEHCRRDLE